MVETGTPSLLTAMGNVLADPSSCRTGFWAALARDDSEVALEMVQQLDPPPVTK